MQVEYIIVNRAEIILKIEGKKMIIQGEIALDPPSFNAYFGSIKNWEPPYENEKISDGFKYKIIKALLEESRKEGNVRILFD